MTPWSSHIFAVYLKPNSWKTTASDVTPVYKTNHRSQASKILEYRNVSFTSWHSAIKYSWNVHALLNRIARRETSKITVFRIVQCTYKFENFYFFWFIQAYQVNKSSFSLFKLYISGVHHFVSPIIWTLARCYNKVFKIFINLYKNSSNQHSFYQYCWIWCALVISMYFFFSKMLP